MKKDDEIKNKHTDELVCPHCGCNLRPPMFSQYDSKFGKLYCMFCGKLFKYERFTTYTYSTFEINNSDDS